jgi:hypothetical protein
MADLRRRLLVMLLLAPLQACVSPTDPFGHEADFRLLQKHFTQYVRWGKVHEAATFVVAEQRDEFLALGPDLTDIRFTDWQTLTLDYQCESARVDVQLRGYRLTAPVERTVRLVQNWEKAEDTGAWQVRLELAALRKGLGVEEEHTGSEATDSADKDPSVESDTQRTAPAKRDAATEERRGAE